ncbi:MAG: DUF799 domain-containing protein [Gammaproteobacteria bacterium]
MGRYRLVTLCLSCAALLLAGGCAPPTARDYTDYRARMPRSVLVLPPLNHSVAVNAPYAYLSTVTRPLAECGYYVFPVAVVDAFMKENGLPTPGEMHAVSLHKIHEVFAADAVLYASIETYGQKYRILASEAVIRASVRLVDVITGATLWEGTAQAVQGSGDSGGGLIGLLLTAAIAQGVGATLDQAHELARQANTQMIFDKHNGLLYGPYHAEYAVDPRGR